MTLLVSLALSIGILGGFAAWGFLAAGLPIWAAFIAWGSFYHCGGDDAALKKSLAANVFGIILLWITALVILNVPMPGMGTAWPAIAIGVAVIILVLAGHFESLAAIPANVYGFATAAGFLLQTPGALSNAALTSVSLKNPLIAVGIAMVLGNVFGLISAKVAAMLRGRTPRTA